MPSERTLLIIALSALVVIVIGAVIAIQVAPHASPTVTLQDLPTRSGTDAYEPTESACQEAGGTVRYEFSNECYNSPSVTDACGFNAIPCFTESKGYFCQDVKDPYCQCASDDQCPENFRCEKTFATPRCYRDIGSPSPYPMKSLKIR